MGRMGGILLFTNTQEAPVEPGMGIGYPDGRFSRTLNLFERLRFGGRERQREVLIPHLPP